MANATRPDWNLNNLKKYPKVSNSTLLKSTRKTYFKYQPQRCSHTRRHLNNLCVLGYYWVLSQVLSNTLVCFFTFLDSFGLGQSRLFHTSKLSLPGHRDHQSPEEACRHQQFMKHFILRKNHQIPQSLHYV